MSKHYHGRWTPYTRSVYDRGWNDAKREDLAIVQDKLMEGSRKILFEIIDQAKMAVFGETGPHLGGKA